VRYRVHSLFVAVLFIALLLVGWREYEHWQVGRLVRDRDAALATWRVVKSGYDVGEFDAEEEATVRERYFKNRRELEAVLDRAWWPVGQRSR
jgi:hypothetical protein